LHRAGVGLLSKHLEISLISAENSRPAEAFRARLNKRRVAMGRVLETLPPDDAGRRAIDRLGQIALVEADEILVKQELRWPHLVSLHPESVPAHGVPEDNKLYLTPESGSRYWPVVARSLLAVLAPAAEPGLLAASLKDVLAAESAADAQSLLDDLGYALLETEDVTGVPAGEPVGLGGTDAPQTLNGEAGADGGTSTPSHEGTGTSDDDDSWSSDEDEAEDDGDGAGEGGGSGGKSGRKRGAGGGTKAGGTRGGSEADGDGTGGTRDGSKGGKRDPTSGEGTRDRGGREKPAQQTRLVSYVLPPTGDGSDGGTVREVLEEDDWHGLGKLGVERVAKEERERLDRCTGCGKWEVKIMPPNHPGYDIEVWIDGAIERYIEVKSLRDAWGARGVGMTPTQFEQAQKSRAKYWLYVVEQVESPDGAVTRIQDPGTRVTRFQFDEGWKPLGS
jgi:hypothetical protein